MIIIIVIAYSVSIISMTINSVLSSIILIFRVFKIIEDVSFRIEAL